MRSSSFIPSPLNCGLTCNITCSVQSIKFCILQASARHKLSDDPATCWRNSVIPRLCPYIKKITRSQVTRSLPPNSGALAYEIDKKGTYVLIVRYTKRFCMTFFSSLDEANDERWSCCILDFLPSCAEFPLHSHTHRRVWFSWQMYWRTAEKSWRKFQGMYRNSRTWSFFRLGEIVMRPMCSVYCIYSVTVCRKKKHHIRTCQGLRKLLIKNCRQKLSCGQAYIVNDLRCRHHLYSYIRLGVRSYWHVDYEPSPRTQLYIGLCGK